MNGFLTSQSIFNINTKDLVNYFVGENDFPYPINRLILKFSGHLHVGKRSLSWIQ